jgi:hypothetical protein
MEMSHWENWIAGSAVFFKRKENGTTEPYNTTADEVVCEWTSQCNCPYLL